MLTGCTCGSGFGAGPHREGCPLWEDLGGAGVAAPSGTPSPSAAVAPRVPPPRDSGVPPPRQKPVVTVSLGYRDLALALALGVVLYGVAWGWAIYGW